ncbi:hypothetical protein [Senegalia massiliensis]|nr:hypothetical protein [Senegalia massiliensis]
MKIFTKLPIVLIIIVTLISFIPQVNYVQDADISETMQLLMLK